MKVSGWFPKALRNFQQIVGVEEYFLLNDIPTEESLLCQKKLMFNECLSI